METNRQRISSILPFATIIIIASWIAVSCFTNLARPPVGTYIGVLAFFAGLVTLFPPDNEWAKAAWFLVFGGFLVLEITTLYRQRVEDVETANNARIAEDNRFADLLAEENKNFAKVLEKNQQAFDITMGRMGGLATLSKEAIDQVTGGDSFPAAIALTYVTDGIPGFPILVSNNGAHTLYELSVAVAEAQDNVYRLGDTPAINLGNLRPYDAKLIPFRVMLPTSDAKDRNFSVSFRARNGGWTEYLHIRREGNGFVQAYELGSNQFPGKPGKVLRRLPFPPKH
jgi:hypothetical protein